MAKTELVKVTPKIKRLQAKVAAHQAQNAGVLRAAFDHIAATVKALADLDTFGEKTLESEIQLFIDVAKRFEARIKTCAIGTLRHGFIITSACTCCPWNVVDRPSAMGAWGLASALASSARVSAASSSLTGPRPGSGCPSASGSRSTWSSARRSRRRA